MDSTAESTLECPACRVSGHELAPVVSIEVVVPAAPYASPADAHDDDAGDEPWVATCPRGHRFKVEGWARNAHGVDVVHLGEQLEDARCPHDRVLAGTLKCADCGADWDCEEHGEHVFPGLLAARPDQRYDTCVICGAVERQ